MITIPRQVDDDDDGDAPDSFQSGWELREEMDISMNF